MRKLLWLILVLCLCSSCSAAQIQPITTGFRCCIQTEYNDVTFEAVLDRTDPSETIVEFQSPEELKGFTFLFADDFMQMQYLGLTFEIPSAFKTESILLSAMLSELDAFYENQSSEASGLVFDESTGMPVSYAFPENNTIVYFSGWELFSTELAV